MTFTVLSQQVTYISSSYRQISFLQAASAVAAKADIKKYSKDFDGTLDDAAVMKITGLARNTYYKYKKEMTEGV